MKKQSIQISILAFSLLVFSCKDKDEDPSPVSTTTTITTIGTGVSSGTGTTGTGTTGTGTTGTGTTGTGTTGTGTGTGLTPSQILTSHTWKIGSRNLNGMSEEILDCEKDDFMSFSNNGNVTLDEGLLKCDPDDPQTDITTYVLSPDAKTLTIDTKTFTVVTLNDNTISLTATENQFTISLVLVK